MGLGDEMDHRIRPRSPKDPAHGPAISNVGLVLVQIFRCPSAMRYPCASTTHATPKTSCERRGVAEHHLHINVEQIRHPEVQPLRQRRLVRNISPG